MVQLNTAFEPRMEQFLRALDLMEGRGGQAKTQPTLSMRMRDSWKTGRFWFDYAIRKSFDIDVVYEAALRQHDENPELDNSAVLAEMELLTQTKMKQLEAHKVECVERFK